ncbi:hypothetical protein [Fodinibius sp. Rm-B-1B1-1]|uniref:hypothetical protein n=1 Tax=Fodinibius alkaliphilus TaxID=3140241 RepID=UPI00315A31BC
MSLFAKCITVCLVLAVLITVLFEVLYDMPLSGSILFGGFAAIISAIFYGWIDDMFISNNQAGLEE